jgi:hypothetical protein
MNNDIFNEKQVIFALIQISLFSYFWDRQVVASIKSIGKGYERPDGVAKW